MWSYVHRHSATSSSRILSYFTSCVCFFLGFFLVSALKILHVGEDISSRGFFFFFQAFLVEDFLHFFFFLAGSGGGLSS